MNEGRAGSAPIALGELPDMIASGSGGLHPRSLAPVFLSRVEKEEGKEGYVSHGDRHSAGSLSYEDRPTDRRL